MRHYFPRRVDENQLRNGQKEDSHHHGLADSHPPLASTHAIVNDAQVVVFAGPSVLQFKHAICQLSDVADVG